MTISECKITNSPKTRKNDSEILFSTKLSVFHYLMKTIKLIKLFHNEKLNAVISIFVGLTTLMCVTAANVLLMYTTI